MYIVMVDSNPLVKNLTNSKCKNFENPLGNSSDKIADHISCPWEDDQCCNHEDDVLTILFNLFSKVRNDDFDQSKSIQRRERHHIENR